MTWLGFLAKLIPHASKIDDIAEAVDALTRAEGSAEYWSAIKVLGDLLQPILLSVTGFEVASEDSAVEAMKLGDGAILKKLKDFMESPIGGMLLQLLLGQIKPA
jgi:hypothetical protein